ncbi:NAD-P-binding protein [Vararia minispora EC-137]|uniref:NAD-P-binding protein n=1 Tax=Vararia minispora EC-137 TaxID=1314806 RepID=A0ACB8QBF9_9AGAM|nr:NAD-P-binding protein [Vararia minispora EC-137]
MSIAPTQKVWLVTGAATGLGLALIQRVLARGGCAIATARSPESLDVALKDLPNTDRDRLRTLKLDVTAGFGELQRTATAALSFWGRVDVLVNNAAITGGACGSEEAGCVPDCRAGHFAMVMATNFYGVIDVTNAFLPHMRRRREGTIIIVGSRSAIRNEFFATGAYSASKAAVHSYGETLAAEVRRFNIRVTIVAPGTMRTTFNHPHIPPFTIADYDEEHAAVMRYVEGLRTRAIASMGDPMKAMDTVIDVVHGEGRAKGRKDWPLWLLLGEDAVVDWRIRANKMLKEVDEWGDLAAGLRPPVEAS